MIIIVTMTLFFLPGTFVSSILSTTYFDFADNGLQVSRQSWVLALMIIPFTVFVFALWLAWLYRSRPGAFRSIMTWICGSENEDSPPGP